MSNKKATAIIAVLLMINAYTLFSFYNLRKQDIANVNTKTLESDALFAYQLNFNVNLQNAGIELENIVLKDSVRSNSHLRDLLNDGQKQILVCRFTELNCESCVSSAIKLFHYWEDSLGKNNMLYLGSYRNNKIFNQTKPLYHIQNSHVYNIDRLNIPIEELDYPYYFILNSDLTVSNLFVPDKALPAITNGYLRMIKKRYFESKNNKW